MQSSDEDREILIAVGWRDNVSKQAASHPPVWSQATASLSSAASNQTTLSLLFAIFCVIDLFGVFPIVALPKSIISCGLYGAPLVLFIITMQIYTAVVLGRCWVIAEKLDPSIVNKNRYPYAAIADLTYGPKASIFVTVLLDVTVFGCGIPNLLVASQNLELLGVRLSNGSFDISFCVWLIAIGVLLCPILCLGSPKNMKVLASVSVVVCSSVAILTSICIMNDENWSDTFGKITNVTSTTRRAVSESVNYKPFFGIGVGYPPIANLLAAYGVVAFQFDIHPMLLTIQVDMKNKRKIGKAVCIGILATCCLSGLVTSLAAYRYGQMTTSNLLETLPKSWILYLVIMLVTVQLCLSSAVGNSALYQHLEDLLNVPRHFTYKRCLVRSGLVFVAVLIGELLPKFDLVMSLIGGSLNGTLIFIMPPLFYTKITRMERAIELERARRETSSDDGYGPVKILNYGTLYSPARRPVHRRPHNGHPAFQSERCCRSVKKLAARFFNDGTLSLAVVFFGLGASLASTYYNIQDVQNSQFWSPCLANMSASFDFIDS